MTRYLLATASVHTTAAAADHLADRLTADDEVLVVTVAEPDLDGRDGGDAANVARTRLLPATVEAPGSTVRALLGSVDVPVVVVPLPEL
ncbi:hypothetical protein [Halosimplex amylolyticum]|uniref:hypothetical protein n=1 Tax=Halosimplex amylolyticum TaxID=3396616 RepID=UPI003F557F9A